MNASENVIPRDSEICDYSDRLLGQPTLRPPSCHSPCTTAIGGRVNLSPLEDQQLGGLIMWIPACSVYLVAGLAFFAGWLREAGHLARRREMPISGMGTSLPPAERPNP